MDDQRSTPPYRESPVVFPAGDESIYGILVEPSHAARDVGVILLSGGGYLAMTHRNRMWVHLARWLAAEGFPVLRFDYHGVGESTGDIDGLGLERPFVADLMGAANTLRNRRISNLVLVGSCFGARTILASVERIPELRGAVLLSTPLGSGQMGEVAAEG
ncbi:MAG: alpha/beta fold hydrolase, partial [Armatimonadota bacterium]